MGRCTAVYCKKAAEANPVYVMPVKQGAENWIDQKGLKKDFNSIQDTLGCLLADPVTEEQTRAFCGKNYLQW